MESVIHLMNAFYIFSWLGHIDLINIMKPLLPASMRVKRVVPAPLTLRMLAGCVTLPPRHKASVTAVRGNICIRVLAQQGERLDWMEIMESARSSSTIIHYDVANPVWVSAGECLPVKGFHFVAGKSYTVLIATVINAKDARQYQSTFTTGQGLAVVQE
ncbi:putative T6SS immunity periplasmic lipoprotein [Cronobacter malonaticus]|uniref:putative T6SS immunity periplasmic lipoprotein n=1 Tax=Cronobacter malonaticus TaxID=413503 RepID=UPI001ED8D403|nr:putative T6SS immunity periplasmic lipoprotein [Cronobacter malonaticus]